MGFTRLGGTGCGSSPVATSSLFTAYFSLSQGKTGDFISYNRPVQQTKTRTEILTAFADRYYPTRKSPTSERRKR